MQPLNPFLSAFFRSTFPSQCTPVHQHVRPALNQSHKLQKETAVLNSDCLLLVIPLLTHSTDTTRPYHRGPLYLPRSRVRLPFCGPCQLRRISGKSCLANMGQCWRRGGREGCAKYARESGQSEAIYDDQWTNGSREGQLYIQQ
jgi:hypothetical protein